MKTVLVVGGERHIVRLCQVNLQRAGFNVATASDARQALKEITAQPPDLIMLDDLMLPLERSRFLEMLQSSRNTRDIPLMAIPRGPNRDNHFTNQL